MSIAAASVECDDLRLAYSSVMNQIDIVPDGSMALNSSQSGNPILTNQAKSIMSNSTASRGRLTYLVCALSSCSSTQYAQKSIQVLCLSQPASSETPLAAL